MPPKQTTSENKNTPSWQDCSLGSVPISIIKYCLSKANSSKDNNNKIPKRVTVHLSKGNNIRYRSDNLISIDDSMNLRLQNVVMSRVKKENNNNKNTSANSQNFVVTARTIGSTTTSNANKNVNSSISNNNQNNLVPFNEQLIGTSKDILLPGSSVTMIELPEEWAEVFEEQAKEVRKEYYRRERALNFQRKEERKKRIEAAKERQRAKKDKMAKKEALMKKGAKRAGKK